MEITAEFIPVASFVPAPRIEDPADRFGRLVEPLLPKAYQTALYLTRDPIEAEEVVQDAALNALRGFASFTPGTNFRAWFLKILNNAFLQRCRAASRQRESVSLDGTERLQSDLIAADAALYGKPDDPAQSYLRQLTDEQVRSAIASLPVALRAVATLYFLHDLRYAQIADIVGCPLGTVRSRLHRARAELKRSLWLLVVDSGYAFEGVEQEAERAYA